MIVATNVATSCDKCFYSSENIYNAKYGDNHACQGGVSADAQQFDFEYQCGTAGYAWLRELAISHFGRKVDFPFVTHAHLLHGYYPSFYQVAQAESGRCTATTAVEFLAVDGPPSVVGRDNAARSRVLAV